VSEALVAKWLDDRSCLTAEEAAELERVLSTDADLARRVKDQLAVDELVSRRLAVDRSNFEAQVAQRIAAGDGGAFTQSTLAAAKRTRRWRLRWPEAAAAGLLIAGLLFLLLRREAIVPGGTPAGSGRPGLRGEYFRNQSLKGEPTVRTDAKLDFAWRKGAGPMEGWIDVFSARWTAMLEPAETGRYTLRTRHDDGVRIWIDGKMIVDRWVGKYEVSGASSQVDLVAGKPVTLKVEYFNGGDIGVLQLFWTPPGKPEEIIPSARFRAP
jgi:hypothetical protein